MARTGNKLKRLLVFRQQRHILHAALLAQAVEGLLQPLLFDGLKQVVEGVLFKGLNRVLIERG